jgi:hypothetical protein
MRKTLKKFTHEAKISCALCSHPNLVKTFGIWVGKDAEAMIVMGKIFLLIL